MGKSKYHKVTREEHQKILASRHSVCPVPYATISAKTGIPARTVRRYANKQPEQVKVKRRRASMFDPFKAEIKASFSRQTALSKSGSLTFPIPVTRKWLTPPSTASPRILFCSRSSANRTEFCSPN